MSAVRNFVVMSDNFQVLEIYIGGNRQIISLLISSIWYCLYTSQIKEKKAYVIFSEHFVLIYETFCYGRFLKT